MKDHQESQDEKNQLCPVDADELAAVEGGMFASGSAGGFQLDLQLNSPDEGMTMNRCETFLGEPAEDEQPGLRPVEAAELGEVEGGIAAAEPKVSYQLNLQLNAQEPGQWWNRCETFLGEPAEEKPSRLQAVDATEMAIVEGGRGRVIKQPVSEVLPTYGVGTSPG